MTGFIECQEKIVFDFRQQPDIGDGHRGVSLPEW